MKQLGPPYTGIIVATKCHNVFIGRDRNKKNYRWQILCGRNKPMRVLWLAKSTRVHEEQR